MNDHAGAHPIDFYFASLWHLPYAQDAHAHIHRHEYTHTIRTHYGHNSYTWYLIKEISYTEP